MSSRNSSSRNLVTFTIYALPLIFPLFILVFAFQVQGIDHAFEDANAGRSFTIEPQEQQTWNPILSASRATPRETEQIMLGGFYSLENNLQAKLLLNNKDSTPKEVRPTIYDPNGNMLQLPPVVVGGMSFRYIDLSEWAAIGGPTFRSGSIRLTYIGKDLAVGAQIYLTDVTRSLSFEEKLENVGGFDSRRLEGVWLHPTDQVGTRIVLSNSSNSNLTVTARMSRRLSQSSDVQTFELMPHQTRILRLREDFVNGDQYANADAVGISLTHQGSKSSLIARAMIADTGRGYSQVVPFTNPTTAKSARLDGAGLHLENVLGERLVPFVVVRNVGTVDTTVNARVPYTRTNGTRSFVSLPEVRVRPGEIRLLDSHEVVQRAQNEQIKTAGIEIAFDAAPGSILAQVQSISPSRNQVFRTLLWDARALRSSSGGYPFVIAGTSTTKAYIKNVTTRDQSYIAYLTWENGGIYMLGIRPLSARETAEIDVKRLRDEQIPDEEGRTIPLSVSRGQVHWMIRQRLTDDGDATANRLALVGQAEQIDVEQGISSAYFCQNCCDRDILDSRIVPSTEEIEVGETRTFQASERVQACVGSPVWHTVSGYGDTSNLVWSTSDPSIATVSQTGLVTTVGVGEVEISASWQTRHGVSEEIPDCGDDGPPWVPIWNDKTPGIDGNREDCEANVIPPHCLICNSFPVDQSASATLIVKPKVTNILARIISTKNPVTNQAPDPGSFSTTNTLLTFAIEDTTDLMVVFQSSEAITVRAQGVDPANMADQIKWKIERDPTDTVATGTPALSAVIGAQTTVSPTTAGNFRLISYFDANNNGTYDNGEELKVLRFAIVRVSISANECSIASPIANFTGDFPNPTEFGVLPGSLPMSMNCEFVIDGGGSHKRIGVSKVFFGNVGNLTANTARVNYAAAGTATENPGGSLPMVDTGRVIPGTAPSGGIEAFRTDSLEGSTNLPGGGQSRDITSSDVPSFGPYKITHQNGNIWASTQGGYDFKEFIVGFSATFPRTYVVVANAVWTIRFIGNRSGSGGWVNNGSAITLQGSTQTSATFSLNVSNGSPLSGNVAGVQVLGLSYVNQKSPVYQP